MGILYHESHISMSRCKLPESDFKVVAAVGRRNGQRRKVVVFTVYIPLDASADTNRALLAHVGDCTMTLKEDTVTHISS